MFSLISLRPGYENARSFPSSFAYHDYDCCQDILRGQYQALSADPNSLANLDQGMGDKDYCAFEVS